MKLLTTCLAASAICLALLGAGAYLAGPAASGTGRMQGLTAATVLGTDGIARDAAAPAPPGLSRLRDLAKGGAPVPDPNG